MRVRNNKNQIFEKHVLSESAEFNTLAFFMFFGGVYNILFIIYLAFTINNPRTAFIVCSFYSFLIFIFIKKGFQGKLTHSKNDDVYTKIKKGKNIKILEKYYGNIITHNSTNYYGNKLLYKNFLGQILYPLIYFSGSCILFWFFLLYTLYNSESFLVAGLLLILAGLFIYLLINKWKKYFIIKKIINKKNICILKRDVGNYYIQNDWIYFY